MPTTAAEAHLPPVSPPAVEPAPVPAEVPSPEVSRPASAELQFALKDTLPPVAVPARPVETPKSAPEVAAVRAAASTHPPETLGTLNLRRNETISGLIQKVYGNYSNRHFRSIILANPNIVDGPGRGRPRHPAAGHGGQRET
jgi:hypothetical protein